MTKITSKKSCLVCSGLKLEKFLTSFSVTYPKLYRRVAICQECGHIQLYPLFNEEEIKKINDNFFDKNYLVDSQENEINNSKKLEALTERLSPHINENQDVLDFGPGEGWALDYFKQKNCNYYAIESVDRLKNILTNKGCHVIGNSIYDDLSKYNNQFDIIIFRHVIEHLQNPKQALMQLKELLAPNGVIYLALPNANKPNAYKGFRTSYIRPVHVSYFCEGNINRLTNIVGLEPIYSETKSEIFQLLSKNIQNKNIVVKNFYKSQKAIFKKEARKRFAKDCINILKRISNKLKKRFKNLTLENIVIASNRKYGKYKLSQEKELWSLLQDYLKTSGSTGCCYSDYWTLYKYVLKNKPTEILECGTGVTTIVMAYALMQNEKLGAAKKGRITSMEHQEIYYEQAKNILPEKIKDFVDMQLSEKKEYYFSYFRGVGYKEIPKRDYDFVFVDGPGTLAPSDGHRSFNIDFINVVKNSNQPVSGIVDQRYGTIYVMQKIFGKEKVKYDPKVRLGFLNSCSKKDLRTEVDKPRTAGNSKLSTNSRLSIRFKLFSDQ